jgi:iron complex transport system substrate-binding protein
MNRLWRATMMAVTSFSLIGLPLAGPTFSGAAVTPACIISLSPSATETLYALGVGRAVKAVDSTANFPKTGLPPRRINAFNPSLEAILSVCSTKPQLVLISYDANQVQEKLQAQGILVLKQPAPANLAGAYSQIKQIGRAVHKARQARNLVNAMRRSINRAIATVAPSATHQRVYYELDPTFYSATSQTFVGSILKLMHVVNIADSKGVSNAGGYPQLSAEYIASANPTIIFLADTLCCGANPHAISSRAAFASVSAVRKHHVYGLNDDIASRWGPRLTQLVRALTRDINLAQKK